MCSFSSFFFRTTGNVNCLFNAVSIAIMEETTSKFNEHGSRSLVYKTATLKTTQFRSCFENKTTPINLQLQGALSEQVAKNRQKTIPII